MDTDALRYFQQVADGVTVTEVAENYQVSQPGVSRALKRLEEEVGASLLIRSGRVLRTTHAGRIFKGHVDAMLHALDDGLSAAEELIDPEHGRIRLAFQSSLGTWLVPNLIAGFRADHPRVRIVITHSESSWKVAEGLADLEFTARRPPTEGVEWRHLLRQPLCLAVPAGHRFANRDEVGLAEVAGEDFVMLGPEWELRATSMELCARAGFAPAVAFEDDDLAVVHGFVAAGLGVAIVPELRAGADPANEPGERVVRLTDPGAFREIGIAWSSSHRLLPSAELFRSYVLDIGLRAG